VIILVTFDASFTNGADLAETAATVREFFPHSSHGTRNRELRRAELSPGSRVRDFDRENFDGALR
jgi:hypothetical protein